MIHDLLSKPNKHTIRSQIIDACRRNSDYYFWDQEIGLINELNQSGNEPAARIQGDSNEN